MSDESDAVSIDIYSFRRHIYPKCLKN